MDGQAAKVAFAGRAPGYEGLDQINVQIPAGVRHGTSVPVVVRCFSGLGTSYRVQQHSIATNQLEKEQT
jgi:uncharacterized protein (TIGR03437 family)